MKNLFVKFFKLVSVSTWKLIFGMVFFAFTALTFLYSMQWTVSAPFIYYFVKMLPFYIVVSAVIATVSVYTSIKK